MDIKDFLDSSNKSEQRVEIFKNMTILLDHPDSDALINSMLIKFDKIRYKYLDMLYFNSFILRNEKPDQIYIVAHNGYKFDFKYFYKILIKRFGGNVVGTFNDIK